jgi:hypothetical protein
MLATRGTISTPFPFSCRLITWERRLLRSKKKFSHRARDLLDQFQEPRSLFTSGGFIRSTYKRSDRIVKHILAKSEGGAPSSGDFGDNDDGDDDDREMHVHVHFLGLQGGTM